MSEAASEIDSTLRGEVVLPSADFVSIVVEMAANTIDFLDHKESAAERQVVHKECWDSAHFNCLAFEY